LAGKVLVIGVAGYLGSVPLLERGVAVTVLDKFTVFWIVAPMTNLQ